MRNRGARHPAPRFPPGIAASVTSDHRRSLS